MALCLNAPLPSAAADDPWGAAFHLEMTLFCHMTWLRHLPKPPSHWDMGGDNNNLFSPERSEAADWGREGKKRPSSVKLTGGRRRSPVNSR